MFTEKERDKETGYDYFGARYYDPTLGRFLSVDPHAYRYPSLTPYNYVGNNPLNFIDPTGMDSTDAKNANTDALKVVPFILDWEAVKLALMALGRAAVLLTPLALTGDEGPKEQSAEGEEDAGDRDIDDVDDPAEFPENPAD